MLPRMPMTHEYHKSKDYATVDIPADFITKNLCKDCDEDGPHITPDHIFRVILTKTTDGTQEMTMFNDYKNRCIIPSNTPAFLAIAEHVSRFGNECYFYGLVDVDDRSKFYINVKTLPTQ